MKKVSKSLILLIAAALLCTSAYSKQIFVSPYGDDSNDGSSRALPIKSVIIAAINAHAGDTVNLLEGCFLVDQAIRFRNSGEPGKPIVMRAFDGAHVVIDGNSYTKDQYTQKSPMQSGTGVIHIEGVKNIRLEGIKVRNAHYAGIMVKNKTTSNIEIVNCSTENSYSSGIALWYCDSVTVRGCEIIKANDIEMKTSSDPTPKEAPHEALTIAGARFFDVHENHIHFCYKEGIDCKEISTSGSIHHNLVHDLPRQGIYIDSWFGLLENVEVFSNTVYDCEWGIAISAEGKSSRMNNIRVYKNLLYKNRGSGILFGVWGKDEKRENIYIFNNTVTDNGTPGHWAGATGGIDIKSQNLGNVFVFNNIVYNNWAFELAFSVNTEDMKSFMQTANIDIRNNFTSGKSLRNEMAGEFGLFMYDVPGDNEFTGDPLFTDAKKRNYSLKRNSPCKNKSIRIGEFGSEEDLGAL